MGKGAKRREASRDRRRRVQQATITLLGWLPVRDGAIWHHAHGIIGRTHGGLLYRFKWGGYVSVNALENPEYISWESINNYRVFWLYLQLERAGLL